MEAFRACFFLNWSESFSVKTKNTGTAEMGFTIAKMAMKYPKRSDMR